MLQSSRMLSYVPTKDLERARSFYEDELGFTPTKEVPVGVIYNCAGDTAFFLYMSPHAGTNQASTAFWEVDDIKSVVAELKAKGIDFEHYDMGEMKGVDSIYVGGGAKAAWFKDPDGNILAIIENGED